MKRVASLCALLSLSTPAFAGGWARATIPGSKVSVDLPGAAEHKTKERSSMAGSIVSDTIVTRDADGWCAATVTQLPGIASIFVSHDGLLVKARDNLLEDYAATQTRWTPTVRDGRDGMRLEFTTRRHPERPERGVAELFSFDGQIVTVLTLRASDAAPVDAEHLFASVDLGD
jgi:hypothetical protein